MMSKGACPVCNGSCRVPAGDHKYKNVVAGYDATSDTFACNNCGGQYMFGKPRGQVNLRKDGTPCKHEYQSSNVGRCLTEYNCVHCFDRYQIDSGD